MSTNMMKFSPEKRAVISVYNITSAMLAGMFIHNDFLLLAILAIDLLLFVFCVYAVNCLSYEMLHLDDDLHHSEYVASKLDGETLYIRQIRYQATIKRFLIVAGILFLKIFGVCVILSVTDGL